MADPAPAAPTDPAILALRTITHANRRDRIVTFIALAAVLFLTWRTGNRADDLVDAVALQAESGRLGAIVDCRETSFERAQGLLIVGLVERQPPDVVGLLIAEYRRSSESLEAPVTLAEERRCARRYRQVTTDDGSPPPDD